MQKFGLALGGGGARGLAHIGYLEALDALRCAPSVMSGCSIGAVIGALYASGTTGADIRTLFEERLPRRGASLHSTGLWLRSLARNLARLGPEMRSGGLVNVDSLVDSLLAPLEGCTFADLPIPLAVVATDFWSGEAVVIEKGRLLPAISASMAIPGLVHPGEFEGRVLMDGGLTNVLPYGPLLDRCDVTIAIDVAGERCPEGGADAEQHGRLDRRHRDPAARAPAGTVAVVGARLYSPAIFLYDGRVGPMRSVGAGRHPDSGGQYPMRRLIRIPLALGLIAGSLAMPASADVIYSNFTAIGTGGAYVGGPDVPSPPFAPTQQAMPFPVIAPVGDTAYALTGIEVPIEWFGYGPNEVRVSIHADDGGHPGSELEQVVVAGTTLTPTVAHAAMSGNVVLPAGGPYWVVLYGVGAAEFGWAPGSPATYSGSARYRDPVAGTPWTSLAGGLDLACRVLGDPVGAVASEPAGWGAVKALFR